MEFSEKFIEKNIGELAQLYDSIHGANINISRIAPDLIDGLKPVQRRALYIMYLKDKGSNFRKLATIAGEVFGHAHPHSPTAIEQAIVNIEQSWNNILPLIDGEGNFGCHVTGTEVLTKDGWKLFEDITYDDELASVDPDTLTVIFEPPTEIFEYEYSGDIISIHLPSCSFAVTPNHKMLVSEFKDNEFAKYKFVEAGKLDFDYMKMITSAPDISTFKFNIVRETEFTNDLINVEHYDGKVYCAEVPTLHTLITRYNGCALVSGNSISGDRSGASRYIKAKLSDYAKACFFEDWKESVVDMELGADEETMMPEYLPSKYPNILLNGCLGIGYACSANMPCFCFREVVEATIQLMTNPKANIILIPDSSTGADIIEQDFGKLCNSGVGSYRQRATYEIDTENNIITITSLPYMVNALDIRERIADIKEKNGLQELVAMNDLSGTKICIRLELKDSVNPYKFIKKLFKEVSGFERSYPVNVTVTNDYANKDYSIKELLLEWIRWRRDQKRSVLNNKRAVLMAEQRTNDVKIFIMNKDNLEETIKIFRTSRNRAEIEERLIKRYKNTPIRMDSTQTRALSNMRMVELSLDSYEACLKRAEELEKELSELSELLSMDNGVDKIIIAELRDGIKRFGQPRRSNVVPLIIKHKNEVDGNCIIQLASDGTILRKQATNAEEEPIPTDTNGFACLVDNDSSFIVVTENGSHALVRVENIPLSKEAPVTRFTGNAIKGKIVALLPIDIERDLCVTLVSAKGRLKRIRIIDIKASAKPLMGVDEDDRIIKGIVLESNSKKELLIYTSNGMGQRFSPNDIRITSPIAKGTVGVNLNNDEIIGMYAIAPEQNQYLLYVTSKGKGRLNNIDYLPARNSRTDDMYKLIDITNREKLIAVVGCNKYDKAMIYFDDETSEELDINKLKESTMGEAPKKIVKKNVVSTNVTKVKIL